MTREEIPLTRRWWLPFVVLPLLVMWLISRAIQQLGSWTMDLGELLEAGMDHCFNWLQCKAGKP